MTDATRLLHDAADDPEDGPLVDLVWAELRRQAGQLLSREAAGHTLQPTALVNEAYLRLIDTSLVDGADRRRFLAVAARCMRRVLIDHARKRRSAKRGGDWERITLHPELVDDEAGTGTVQLDDLCESLERLAEADPRAHRVVELRYFGGLSENEAAEVLGVSYRTVRNDWRVARAWLKRDLGGGGAGR